MRKGSKEGRLSMRSIKTIFQVTFLLATFFLLAPQTYANPLGDKEVALFKAIEESDIQTVESLLDQGVDLDVNNSDGITPLGTAFVFFIMGEQSSQITEALINAGADVETRGINGETLLHTAVALTSAYLKDFFIQSGNEQVLASLQQQNCIKGIEILLNAEADIEARSRDGGMSILQIAIGWDSDTEVIEMLIENGADVNGVGISDVGAMPPLLLALINNRLDVMEYLISRGADVHVRSSTEETLLHVAATANLFEAIEMLVHTGIDVDEPDNKGLTPLHLAAAENHLEAVTTLLSLGADREAIDSFGKKPEDRSSITFDLN